MYSLKIILFSLVLLVFKSNLHGQTNKSAQSTDIKTQSIWVSEKGKKGEKKYKKQELRFNRKGFCIEEIHYNSSGKIIQHKSYKYNDNDLLEREIEFDFKGFIICRIEFHYKKKILTDKTYYNGKGEIVRQEQMIYEYQD